MSEEVETTLTLDAVPHKGLVEGESGLQTDNGVSSPIQEGLPPVPSPTSSSKEMKSRNAVVLKLETSALDKLLNQISKKIENHEHHLGRLDALEKEVRVSKGQRALREWIGHLIAGGAGGGMM